MSDPQTIGQPTITLNVVAVMQGLIIVFLAGAGKYLFGLKSTIDVMKVTAEAQASQAKKFDTHIETAHVHPVQFESMAQEMRKMSRKMDLMWDRSQRKEGKPDGNKENDNGD